MSLPYKYIDSGIKWIGEVPDHWCIGRIKTSLTFKVGFTPPTDNLALYEGENIWVTIDDLTGELIIDSQYKISNEAINQKKDRLVKKGALLISFKLSIGKFGFAGCDLYTNEAIASFEPNNKIDLRFLNYYLRDNFQFYGKENIYGAILLNNDLIKNVKFPFPPKSEQTAIADYLDKVCAEIDHSINLKTKQLKILEEHLRSTIFELMKGSINSDSKIDSLIPFIGIIPVSWKITRLKLILDKINSGVTPKGGSENYLDSGVKFFRSQNIQDFYMDQTDIVHISLDTHKEMSNSVVIYGDVLLNITGASLGRCNYYMGEEEANVNQHVCILRPSAKILTRFLHLLMISEIGQSQINSAFTGSGREGLSFRSIKNFLVPLPSINEQHQIVNAIENYISKYRAINKTINSQIDKLTFYKKSLIHEVVTGKKQVVGLT